jgi:hypothetical protein
MQHIFPVIEDDIPLPLSATEALPRLSQDEELQMRARTALLLSELNGQPLSPNQTDIAQAEKLALDMMSNPDHKPDFAIYKNETIAYLAGMVSQMNSMIVKDLSELKLYVVNKLVNEAESAKSSKDRISALSKLGEVDGVDAFKKRIERSDAPRPLEEVESEILRALESIKNRVEIHDAKIVSTQRALRVEVGGTREEDYDGGETAYLGEGQDNEYADGFGGCTP